MLWRKDGKLILINCDHCPCYPIGIYFKGTITSASLINAYQLDQYGGWTIAYEGTGTISKGSFDANGNASGSATVSWTYNGTEHPFNPYLDPSGTTSIPYTITRDADYWYIHFNPAILLPTGGGYGYFGGVDASHYCIDASAFCMSADPTELGDTCATGCDHAAPDASGSGSTTGKIEVKYDENNDVINFPEGNQACSGTISGNVICGCASNTTCAWDLSGSFEITVECNIRWA